MVMTERPGILNVDDNPFNRTLIRTVMNKHGIPVRDAENGIEALARVKESEFELIFMDLLMPEMDGFETAKRIRGLGITTPIIAVSAISLKQDRSRALASGCNDFLPKPVDIKELVRVIKSYGLDREAREKNIGPAAQPGESASGVARSTGADLSGFHLVLVESDRALSKRYTHMLEEIGLQVESVTGGSEAWNLLQNPENRVDIIVSNIFTPEIDALGLLAMVKREFPKVLMFIYTKEYDAGIFQMAIQQGVDGIVPQSRFDSSAANLIGSGITQSLAKGARARDASTALQVRKAQQQLISYGCPSQCDFCDMAYAALHDAGGDIVQCRRFNRAGRCGMVLADVAGHDVASSYTSAMFSGMLAAYWNQCQDPDKLIKTINAEFLKSEPNTTHICATFILYDRLRRKMRIAAAGNPGGLILVKSSDGTSEIRELAGGGMGLGLLKETGLFIHEEVDFSDESYVIFFSDGLEKEGVEDALSRSTGVFDRESVKGFSQEIMDRILEKRAQEDDIAVLALHVPGQCETRDSRFSFRSGYKGVDEACSWALKMLKGNEAPAGHDIDFVLIALRELLLNAVEHGNRRDENTYVDLTLLFAPDELKIEVSDEGSGFDLDDKLKEMRNCNGFQIGKRGLSLITGVADSIEIDGGTAAVTFRKRDNP